MSLSKAPPALDSREALVIVIVASTLKHPTLAGVYTDRSLAIRHYNETLHNDRDVQKIGLHSHTLNHPHEPLKVLLWHVRTEGEECPCETCRFNRKSGTSPNFQGGPHKLDGKPALLPIVKDYPEIDMTAEPIEPELVAPPEDEPPLLLHYRQAKAERPGVLLFVRIGDFYEAFEEDARIVADALNITLTGRTLGDSRVDMAGVPHHATERYVARLIRKGYRVALMDAVEPGVNEQTFDGNDDPERDPEHDPASDAEAKLEHNLDENACPDGATDEGILCPECEGVTVLPSDPYNSSPCGTFCDDCMMLHAKECGVCASEFDIDVEQEEDDEEEPAATVSPAIVSPAIVTQISEDPADLFGEGEPELVAAGAGYTAYDDSGFDAEYEGIE